MKSADEEKSLKRNKPDIPVTLQEEFEKALKADDVQLLVPFLTESSAAVSLEKPGEENLDIADAPPKSILRCTPHEALIIASRHGASEKCLEYIFTHKPDINYVTDGHKTALHLASLFGHFTVVNFLLQQPGIEIDKTTRKGCGALYLAAYSGHFKVVEILIAAGANPNLTTEVESSPLIAASAKGHFDIVKLLLEHKANVNHANKRGVTALHSAAALPSMKLVDLLCSYGASATMKNVEGVTAQDILEDAERKTQKIQAVLNQWGVKGFENQTLDPESDENVTPPVS